MLVLLPARDHQSSPNFYLTTPNVIRRMAPVNTNVCLTAAKSWGEWLSGFRSPSISRRFSAVPGAPSERVGDGHRAPLGRPLSSAEPLTRICFPHAEIPTEFSLPS
jgi:hypothetical protein